MPRVPQSTKTTIISGSAARIALLGFAGFAAASCVGYDYGYEPGAFTPHPHPGINQIECPPPARPECLPGRA